MQFLRDLKVAVRSLARARALWITVGVTLALGIGANAAIFSVVRGVLLRPLANRDEDRLLYIRQSAPGIGNDNATFSVPEIKDIGSGLKTIKELGTFSEIDFTMVGLGEPREIHAGVVDGNYFEVMGLRPVIGRLLGPGDDGPNAAGAAVLTYRFWSTSLHSDPSVIGKTLRLESFGGPRNAVIVGVLEPSVPYPVETELIANVITSPHHLSATMVTGREHRMTEVFARLAPGAELDSAQAELGTVYAGMLAAHPDVYKPGDHFQIGVTRMHDQINSRARTILWVLFAASGLLFVIACSNVANLVLARTVRRESELAIRSALGASRATLRRSLLAEAVVLCGSGAFGGRRDCGADGHRAGPLRVSLLCARPRSQARFQHGVDWRGACADRRRFPGVRSSAAVRGFVGRPWTDEQRRPRYGRKQEAASDFCRNTNHRVLPAARWGGCAVEDFVDAGKDAAAVRDGARSSGELTGDVVWADAGAGARFLSQCADADQHAAGSGARIVRIQRSVARWPGTEHQLHVRRGRRNARECAGGSARAVPDGNSRIFRNLGAADSRRPRFQ